jgi:exodeoxyribonuclease VII small subunit
VSKIEQGEISLQESLSQYERGMALIKQCRTILQQAEKRIEKISQEKEKEEKPE